MKVFIVLYYKMSYLKEEVNCTEPSPSVKIPCLKDVMFHFPEYWGEEKNVL